MDMELSRKSDRTQGALTRCFGPLTGVFYRCFDVTVPRYLRTLRGGLAIAIQQPRVRSEQYLHR